MDLDDDELKATRRMNGSDKNVGSMEKDIKILEKMLKTRKEQKEIIECAGGYCGNCNPDIKALENAIQTMKAYKELEEGRQIVGMPVRNKRDGRIGIVLHQWKSGSVAVLESINPRVINTHDSWNTLEIVTDEVKQTKTKCETIPVSLVEEKIEELKQERTLKYDNYMGYKIESREQQDIDKKVQVLQELLEKR